VRACAGLVFFDLAETPGAIFQRLAALFFLVLLCAPSVCRAGHNYFACTR